MNYSQYGSEGKYKISYIVPAHNCSDYLEQCISSIVNQKFDSFEVIIIENGSTDSTKKLCQTLQAKNPEKVKLLFSNISSPGAARNIGIEYASGELLCFVDADDYISENHASKVVSEFSDDIDLLIYSTTVFTDAQTVGCIALPYLEMGPTETIDFCYNKPGAYTTLWNKVFRHGLLDNERFDEGYLLSEDVLFLSKILPNISKSKSIPDSLYNWRRHSRSLSTNVFARLDDVGIGIISVHSQIRAYFEENCEPVLWIPTREYMNAVRNIVLEAYAQGNKVFINKYKPILKKSIKDFKPYKKHSSKAYLQSIIVYCAVKFRFPPAHVVKMVIASYISQKYKPRKSTKKSLG